MDKYKNLDNKNIKNINIIVEICCGSFEDAIHAFHGGAKRIELNSALHLGGLTPSVASLKLVKQHTDLEVICMVRPRGAGFCYSELEQQQIFVEAEDLLKNGADGLAFGFLTIDKLIDTKLTAKMTNLIHQYHKTAVFHRAFDCVNEPFYAMDKLIELNIDRILTSGLQPTAIKGQELLKKLQLKAENKVELLAGSGINYTNVIDLIKNTKLKQVHSSCKKWQEDITTTGKFVNYTFNTGKYQNHFDVVDEQLVQKLVLAVNTL